MTSLRFGNQIYIADVETMCTSSLPSPIHYALCPIPYSFTTFRTPMTRPSPTNLNM